MELAEQQASSGRWLCHLAALLLTLAGLGVALRMIQRSEGGFYHDDDITHYLMSVKAWDSPLHRWHLWGRPGYTVPTLFVAHYYGLTGCRVFSAIQTALVAFLAYWIARRIGAGAAAAAAPVLVWMQPLAMTLSLTTLTETPAALYLTLAVWLYLRGSRVLSCAAMSLLFVTRYETAALAPVLFGAIVVGVLRQRQWKPAAAVRAPAVWASVGAMAWAPLTYIAASLYHGLSGEASLLYLLSNHYTEEYGKGTWYHYLEIWPAAAGAGVLALAAVGALAAGRRGWLPTAMTGLLVALHGVLFYFGLFASGGYPRFLVVESGLVGALAAAGAGLLFGEGFALPERPDRRARLAAGGIVAIIALDAVVTGLGLLGPGAPVGWLPYRHFLLLGAAAGIALAIFGGRALAGQTILIAAVAGVAVLAKIVSLLQEELWLIQAQVPGDLVPAYATAAATVAVLAAAGAAAFALVRPRRSVYLGLALAALIVSAMVTTFQARLQVRPLIPDVDPHRVACAQAVAETDRLGLSQRHALAGHVLMALIRPNTYVGGSAGEERELWEQSPPGTLFFWDNKNTGPRTPQHPFGQLYQRLEDLGECIAVYPFGEAQVLVFVRTGQPAGEPSTNDAT